MPMKENSVKRSLLVSMPIALFGLLLALVPGHVLPVCAVAALAPPMRCHWSGSVLAGFGTTFFAAGALLFLSRQAGVRTGISIMILPVAALAAMAPTYLIGMCRMATMPCRTGTYPAAMILLALVAASALFNILYLRHHDNREPGDA